jgi:hypothetical protein
MEAQAQRSFSASLVSDGFRGFPEFDGLAKDFTQTAEMKSETRWLYR